MNRNRLVALVLVAGIACMLVAPVMASARTSYKTDQPEQSPIVAKAAQAIKELFDRLQAEWPALPDRPDPGPIQVFTREMIEQLLERLNRR